ncbi:MAG: flavodoxin family protein [Treponema sp.]|nr:flavodoxin family protein [Treponema sp.]
MKVLMINGSPHTSGCTGTALAVAADVLKKEEIDTETINLGGKPIRDCIGCNKCKKLENRCTFDDDCINSILQKAETADGFIFGTPVYYAHPSGRILSALDRLFYAGSRLFEHKPGFALASARRAGTTASFDVLNKYFTIAQMPVASASYWTAVHGNTAAEVQQDQEGLLTVRHAATNLAWLIKCIDAGKKAGIPVPVNTKTVWTNFIR